MPVNKYHVIIIGGGFAGTANAYYLARRGLKVIVLEAGCLCSGTSGACAGRAQIIEGAQSENYLDMVLSGFTRLETLGEELDCDLEWELPGHLTLVESEEEWSQYGELVASLVKRGAFAEMIDHKSLLTAEPLLCADQFLGAAYSLEGHLNPFKFCIGFANAARRHGAVIKIFSPVVGFEIDGDRLTAVLTSKESFSSEVVLVACGAWTAELLAHAGISLPMHFSHAEAFITEPLPTLINHHVGMTGFYEAVHGQDRTVTLGVGQHQNGTILISNAVQKKECIDNRSTEWGMPAIARKVTDLFPALAGVRIMRTWAAPSPFLPDYLPVIGWVLGCENLFVAAGFHLAVPTIPVLCDHIADVILNKEDISVLAPFTPARFLN